MRWSSSVRRSRDAALAAPLSSTTREALRFATAYADGRWLWLKVVEPAVVDDVKTLMLLKAAPPARERGPRRRVLVSAG